MVPFCPFHFRVPLLKPNNKAKGTLIIMGLLRNLVAVGEGELRVSGKGLLFSWGFRQLIGDQG